MADCTSSLEKKRPNLDVVAIDEKVRLTAINKLHRIVK